MRRTKEGCCIVALRITDARRAEDARIRARFPRTTFRVTRYLRKWRWIALAAACLTAIGARYLRFGAIVAATPKQNKTLTNPHKQ